MIHWLLVPPAEIRWRAIAARWRLARLAELIGAPDDARRVRRATARCAVRLAWWLGWRACAVCAVLAAASWRIG